MRLTIAQAVLTASLCVGEPFDGLWWNSKPLERRLGFLAGESDCHQYETRGRDRGFRSIQYAQDRLDAFYAQRSNQKILIGHALAKTRPNPDRAVRQGGDPHLEKHGYYDGAWWRSVEPKAGRLGFLEGYISCLPNGRTMFPRPVEDYVGLVDAWYARPESSEVEKIADVLLRYRIRPRND